MRIKRGLIFAFGLLLSSPAMGYITKKIVASDGQLVQERWKTSGFPITWSMNPTRGANVTGARELADVFRLSFQAWSSVNTATVSFREGSATAASVKPAVDGVNLISTNVTAAEWLVLAAGATDALGFTLNTRSLGTGAIANDPIGRNSEFAGQIIESDVLFNPNTSFSTELTTPSNRIDLQSVATHEIGHLLGLDHTNLVSSTMFPTFASGANFGKVLSTDEVLAVSSLYPTAAFTARGSITGIVRTTAHEPVFGALVVAVNSNGQPVASTITDPDGRYVIAGLDAGSYTLLAEPMDQPFRQANWQTGGVAFPGFTVFTNFTTRFR